MDIIYEILKVICSGLLLLLIAIWNGICWLCSALWEYKEEIFYGICCAICYIAKGIWWLISNIFLGLYNLIVHAVHNFEFGSNNPSTIFVYFLIIVAAFPIIRSIIKAHNNAKNIRISEEARIADEKWWNSLSLDQMTAYNERRRRRNTQYIAEHNTRQQSEYTSSSLKSATPKEETIRNVSRAMEESYITKNTVEKSTCAFCSSSMYGPSCQYSNVKGKNFSVGKVHMHSPDGKHCVYCGSTSMGPGCPYSPTGIHSRMN